MTDFFIKNNFLVMLTSDMDEWMDKISEEPFAAKLYLRELFSNFYIGCNCRVEGILAVPGKVNHCLICYRHLSSLDAHAHLDQFDLALISWLALVWKGKEIFKP